MPTKREQGTNPGLHVIEEFCLLTNGKSRNIINKLKVKISKTKLKQ